MTADDRSIPATSGAAAIESFLSCDDDFTPGGLSVSDGDVVIDPGSCSGSDEWREWLRVVGGDRSRARPVRADLADPLATAVDRRLRISG